MGLSFVRINDVRQLVSVALNEKLYIRMFNSKNFHPHMYNCIQVQNHFHPLNLGDH